MFQKIDSCNCGIPTDGHKEIGITKLGRWINCPECKTTLIEPPCGQTIADWLKVRYMLRHGLDAPRCARWFYGLTLDSFLKEPMIPGVLDDIRAQYDLMRKKERDGWAAFKYIEWKFKQESKLRKAGL